MPRSSGDGLNHDLSPRYLEIAKIVSNAWWNLVSDNMRSGLTSLVQAMRQRRHSENEGFLGKAQARLSGARRKGRAQ